MSNSLKASTTGLAIVDKARQRLGWTKTSTARWWQDAHTSRATLRRFWQGERIQREIFIAICQSVGISSWEAIVDTAHPDLENIDILPFYFDWYEAPNVESFCGRHQELAQLESWLINVNTSCKLVNIIGLAGIGKTALVLALADRIQSKFDCLIWKSLQTSPSLNSLLDSLLNTFNQPAGQNIQQSTTQLIQQLQQCRCLLILDGLDTILSTPEHRNIYHQFIQQLNRENHQSCIIITSREQPKFIEINTKTVYFLKLKGLQNQEAIELLKLQGFTGKELGLSALIQLYRGNPLALKLVIPLIQSVFMGNVAAFLNQNTIIVGDRLKLILKQQFEQLAELEKNILYWLAIWQEPVSFSRLQTHLLISIDPAIVLEGIVTLEKRSLLEKWVSDSEFLFTLQPLVMKVVTDELVENAAQEIHQFVQNHDITNFQILRTHWLLRPGTDDIIGDHILHQLRAKLLQMYGANLPKILLEIVSLFENQSPLVIGYIACNIAVILKQL